MTGQRINLTPIAIVCAESCPCALAQDTAATATATATVVVTGEAFGDLVTGAIRHKLLAGVDRLERRVADTTTRNTALAPVDLFHPVPTGRAAYSAAPLFMEEVRAADTGLYLQDQMAMGPWSLMLGLRHDRLKESYEEAVLDFRNRHDSAQTSPSAGLLYRVAPQLTLYASYTRSLDSNMSTDGCGRSYAPSRGMQYELGAKGTALGGLQWAVAAFDLKRSNGLSEDPGGAVDADDNACLVQGAEQRSTGVELEASGRVSSRLRVHAAYARLHARFTGDTDPSKIGHRLRNAPRRSARLWADYAFSGAAQGWSASLGMRNVGERFANDANTLKIPSYTVWDAGLRCAFGKTGTLQLTVHILANRRHVEDSQANANAVNQGAPRSLSARYTHVF